MKKRNKVIAALLIIIALLMMTSLVLFLLYADAKGSLHRLTMFSNPDQELFDAYKTLDENGYVDWSSGLDRLSVIGSTLQNEEGEIVVLKGISSMGVLWYPQYTSLKTMKALKEAGCNVHRVAVYSDDVNGGYIQNKEQSLSLAFQAIDNALASGMYAIVDWHILSDNDPMKNIEEAKEFFTLVSSRYKDNPGVLYEICNEPNGNTGWDEIKRYSEVIIPLIREKSPSSVILVGVPDYSHDIASAASNPISFDNIMYVYHFYAGEWIGGTEKSDDYVSKLDAAKDIPIFITEAGMNPEVKGSDCFAIMDDFLKEIDERNISVCFWGFSNKKEPYSFFESSFTGSYGWTDSDLTDVGRTVFKELAR